MSPESAKMRAIFLSFAVSIALPVLAQVERGSLDVKWHEGASDCQKSPQPPLQAHGHLDHLSGDEQFVGQAHTEVVGTTLEDVTRHFHFTEWPNRAALIDLGERIVDVLPTPGHYESELSFYDRRR